MAWYSLLLYLLAALGVAILAWTAIRLSAAEIYTGTPLSACWPCTASHGDTRITGTMWMP